MKSKFVLGMVAVTLTFSTVFAAPMVRAIDATNYKTEISNYRDALIKPALFGKGKTSASGLAGQAVKIVQDKVLGRFELDNETGSRLLKTLDVQQGVAATDVEARLEQISSLAALRVAGKQMSERADQESKELGKSLMDSANAQLKAMADLDMNGTPNPSSAAKVSGDEQKTADEVASKFATQMEENIRGMKSADRDNWTAVFNKRNELLQSGKVGSAGALIQAIMEVRGVSRDKAVEILKRMKECV